MMFLVLHMVEEKTGIVCKNFSPTNFSGTQHTCTMSKNSYKYILIGVNFCSIRYHVCTLMVPGPMSFIIKTDMQQKASNIKDFIQ